MTNKRGFTVLELVTVIIIIGILATIAVTHYASTREGVLDKEAITNLKLIQGQERVFKVETGSYYPDPLTGTVSDNATINQNLVLLLPSAGTRSWNYTVKSTGCGYATRNGGNGRSWYLTIDNNSSALTGTCP